MRITGGKLTGFSVTCPAGVIRPAMDRMRESVFAILGDLSNKSFLDLFSGSATIAIEAMSRGSLDIELCEKDKIKTKTILSNVERATEFLNDLSAWPNESGATPIRCHFMPAEYFIKRCTRTFDIIFLDPPFPYEYGIDLISKISKKKVLAQGGTLIFHHPREKHTPIVIDSLHKNDVREYGRSIVDFFVYE